MSFHSSKMNKDDGIKLLTDYLFIEFNRDPNQILRLALDFDAEGVMEFELLQPDEKPNIFPFEVVGIDLKYFKDEENKEKRIHDWLKTMIDYSHLLKRDHLKRKRRDENV